MDDPAAMVNLVHPDDVPIFTAAVVKSMSDLSLFNETLRIKNAHSQQYMDLLDRSQPYRSHEMNQSTGQLETVTIWKGFIMLKDHHLEMSNATTTSSSNKKTDDPSDVAILMESPLIPFFSLQTMGGGPIVIQKWNKVMTEATGFAVAHVQGKEASTLFQIVSSNISNNNGSNNSDSNLSLQESLLRHPKTNCIIKSRTGNDVHLILSAHKPLNRHNPQQLSSTIYVVCQDVTQLEHVTAQRNEATKLAESERSLTEWLSHEIRNPLSVVMEAAQTLEAQQEQDQTMDPHDSIPDLHHSVFEGSYLQLIKHSITYVVDILTNMLDLNKLAEGKIHLRPETVRVYEDVLRPTQQMMSLCGKIPVELQGPNVEIPADKLRLKQVFCNLISNAMKYTSRGVIRISVHPEEDSFVAIKVSDAGIGIKPSQYPHLFSRFEKLGSSVNGAGIGLCLCKNLVTAMGGDIYLNKDYDSGVPGFPGAQFVVRLPCLTKRAPAFDALSAALVATASTVSRSSQKPNMETKTRYQKTLDDMVIPSNAYLKGKFRILVVDDEVIGQKLLVRRFQRIFPDATIESALSGETAVEMAQATRYDLITMDHYMKVDEWTGAETIAQMRRQQIDALIVGISGNSMREEHVAAGANDFFQKPLPATNVVIRRLASILPPPSCWKVLLVDNVEANLMRMEQDLQALSTPHKLASHQGHSPETQRWNIVKCTLASRAKSLMEESPFDLVVLDQALQSTNETGTDLCEIGRRTHDQAIFVWNSGSSVNSANSFPPSFNLAWTKPWPCLPDMRLDLFRQLLCCPPPRQPRQ